ncbi:MAG TPA: transketolase [Armatimonadetes bacterium]|nr:transketolase [Armatimonadota bacterium]
MSEQFDREEFDRLAAEFRYVITDMICRAGSGHLGGALSLVEIVISLYWRIMRYDPTNPKWPDRDRLVMSKGHAGPVLYMALAYRGFFPKATLKTMNEDGTMLPSHVDRIRTPGIDMTAGSLGQGLSAACGIAYAGRLDGANHDVYCIIGDGESNEGQVWEAAMTAAHRRLGKVLAIVDNNGLQIDGFVKDVKGVEPLADKWSSFGWDVRVVDGHDFGSLLPVLESVKEKPLVDVPTMVIARTVKGKGVSIFENQAKYHGVAPSDDELARALQELGAA